MAQISRMYTLRPASRNGVWHLHGTSHNPMFFRVILIFMVIFILKLQLGALIPRSVCWSVCPYVCPPKITKHHKILQNIRKQKNEDFLPHPFMCKDCQGSFGIMPELSWRSRHFLAVFTLGWVVLTFEGVFIFGVVPIFLGRLHFEFVYNFEVFFIFGGFPIFKGCLDLCIIFWGSTSIPSLAYSGLESNN